MRDHIDIDFCQRIDLPPIVIERHQQIGSEYVGLMLNLAVLGIPADNVLVAAADAIRIRSPVQEVVAKFVGKREIDAALGRQIVVVKNAPAFFPGRRAKQRPIKTRQSVADRCSTVHYDGMHLDVTPAVRLVTREEKTSFIFHSKPSHPNEPKLTLYANPFGFGQWFIAGTPADEVFGLFFEKRSLDYDRLRLEAMAKADTAPVPPQMPVYRKSRALICLQLIKRWRNLAYDRRHARLRMPPSVLLAYYVALNANQTRTLADELIHQVECMINVLEDAERRGRTVHEVNPACTDDVLTDRWPADLSEQRVFIGELRAFAVQLYRLQKGVPLDEMQRILEDLFGERPAREAVRKYAQQHINDNDAGKGFHILRTGSIPALGSAAVPAEARPTPRSSPWGD